MSLSTTNSTQLVLRAEIFGPPATYGDTVWEQLTDIEGWKNWSKTIDSVEREDSGNIGRGSVFTIKSGSSIRDWQIVHWHPGKRVDFVIQTNGNRIGYSFYLNDAVGVDLVQLQLSIEFEFHGIQRLFSNFLRYRERKAAEQLFDDFIFHVKTLLRPNP